MCGYHCRTRKSNLEFSVCRKKDNQKQVTYNSGSLQEPAESQAFCTIYSSPSELLTALGFSYYSLLFIMNYKKVIKGQDTISLSVSTVLGTISTNIWEHIMKLLILRIISGLVCDV